jgi:amino acid adenylation domain-containing protein
MLFHSLLDKSSQAYFEQVSYRLHGKLDPSLVERSVNVLFQRHSALRTVFLYEDLEQPLQVLLKERKVAFYSASIADLPDDQKEDYITAFKQKDVERSFRLEYDPLLRVSLLQVAPSVYEFIFSHHHIIMDGWCIGILISEYFEIYKSLAENTDCKLAPQREYKEYIRWLMNRDMASARHFWTIYLQGYNEIATLSVKKALPGEYVNEQFTFGIGQEKMAQINQLATISRVTLSTIVQSLWAIVLAKYSGKEEVVFGAVVSGRPAEIDGIETMVGLFINTIPVRIKIEDDTKLTALLAKVQREALEAEPNHYLPLAEIQSTSELKHNLFDQLVIVENFPLQTQLDDAVSQQNEDTDELEISNLSVFEQTSYDFNLMVTPGRQTGIMFKYNSRVYSKAFAEQLSASLLHLFDQLIENPETAIGKLTLLPAETLDSKVAAFNNTFLNYPRQALVHELFEKYAITTPGNTAIKTKSGQYSYSRVNDVANNLAAYMMNEMDVQPGDLVGLMCDRSHWLVICMLAIMKTGAAYVPLDPGFPEERLRYIAEDSGMKVLLQQSKFSGKDIFPGKTLHFDQALSNGSGSNRFPLINASSADTIYVIYTSGSTGKPKGVPITHRSVINLLNSVGNDLRFSSADCFLAVTSYSFDISVLELFLPLINGARLLLADSSVVSNAHLLQQLIEKEQPSVMQATPSLWKMLIESGWPGQTHLKVLCGGERLTPDLGLKLLERSAELYNMYGPTETTIWSTRKKITTAGELATIGTPVANTQVYITDNHTRLLPPGIAGELLIGGDGLSTGYHNRESLTREKFIANPFRENSTLYRTGDIARWLPNGEIEFLGRNDEQVKVRGYRIELGEIEDILQQHPRVKEAVVLLKKWEQEESLVAYYTSEETLATEELISFLMRSLPVFMIPSYFVYLKAMPQTPNGKTDRKALPLPVELHTEESGYAPAETALQEKLVIMWQDILGREKIGRTANFFEMGGHSLKATRLMSRIYKELGIRPEIRNIFTYPVLENFAAAIDQDNVATSLPIALLEPAADYALSPVQEQMWVMNQFEAERFSYIIPAAFWLHGRIDIAAFTRSLETLAERHEILRTVFVITGGEPRQKILTVREMNFRTTYTDISTQPDKDALAAEMAGNEAQTPMDLENGPLIRAGLIKVEEEKHLFLLTMHHIITDDWSMEVVVNEMFALYNSYSRGLNNPLPAIKIQYKEYAAWQLEMLKQRSAEHLQFWLQQFSRPVPLPDLRPDYTDVTVKTGRAEEIIFTCSKAVKDELTAVAGANDATLYMALLAAINVYLSAYTGQTDIVIGTPYAGREHPELENQLGPYLNTLALRTAFNREIYFDDLVKTIKDNLLNSIQHGMFPMNKVIHALQQKSGVQGLYLFNVGFTWHNTAGILDESDTAAVTDFTIEDFQSEAQRVKTDFWFHAWEGTEEVRFSFLYNADLFKRSSMMSLVEDLKLLLATIRSGTLQPIGNLVSLIEENKKNKLFMEKQDAHDRNLKKFFGAAPKKAGDAVAVLVKESLLENGQPYPVVIKPALNGLILDQWAKENVAWLKQKLTQTGALLLRGFHVPDIAAFREFANAFSEDLMNYMDQSSPRTLVGEKLYTSTDHPADQVIHMHNELSYSQTWPLQIMFHCVQPPEEGGETPVCDTRRILDLLSEKTKADFAEKGIMYTRNIREGFGLSWQDVYQTTSREVVEEYCKNHDIRYTWVNDNRLQISWNGPAILDHPVTGEKVWFNHGFFFNEFALDNEIRKMVGNQDDLPFNTLYGDGTPIPEEVIREIGSAYAGTRKIFTWEKGDVLLLDNMLMSHGRNAFSGKRKIVVAMSNPYSLAAVNIPS